MPQFATPTHHNAPAWGLPQLNACKLCSHGEREGTVCLNRQCGGPIKSADARATGGPCGPEARYLFFPGLE